jgi:hypothetical protein
MNLPRNPFPVAGSIRQCWLFVYRTPVEVIRDLLPSQFEPVTHGGFAFWNIVVCRLSGMRPVPLPAAIGLGYWHVAYRLHVRARTESGVWLEGLHFLRSDCDRTLVVKCGNLLTDFNFHLADVRVSTTFDEVVGAIESQDAAARFRIDRHAAPALADGSPFATLQEAAGALKYKPFGLSPSGSDAVNIVRVVRKEAAWRSRVAAVSEADWQFFTGREVALELCYEVEPIDYIWERGRIVRVKSCAS